MELQRHQSGMHFPLEQWNWSTSQLDASGLPTTTVYYCILAFCSGIFHKSSTSVPSGFMDQLRGFTSASNPELRHSTTVISSVNNRYITARGGASCQLLMKGRTRTHWLSIQIPTALRNLRLSLVTCTTTKLPQAYKSCKSYILTSDVGQSEAFSRQTVIRVEVDPDVVLGGDVGGRQGGTTNTQPIQAPIAANGHPV